MQTSLPTVGPGALYNREDATQQAAKVGLNSDVLDFQHTLKDK